MSHSWNTVVACALAHSKSCRATVLLLTDSALAVRYGIRNVRSLTRSKLGWGSWGLSELWRIDEIGGTDRTSDLGAVLWLREVLR